MLTVTLESWINQTFEKLNLSCSMGWLILLFPLIVRINRGLQTYVPYVGRNSTFLAMNRLTNPQATNKRLAFLSSPR